MILTVILKLSQIFSVIVLHFTWTLISNVIICIIINIEYLSVISPLNKELKLYHTLN